MTHASLFSGIGGFDIAARWAGWENLFNCEIDPFCQTVLKYHFPHAEQYADIKTTDFTPWRGKIDVLSGGFPCQPFSQAGKRKGTEDERHLWPEMLRAIQQIQPRWVVGENVLGIVNWSKGLVFEQVCADLETAGYEVQPFILPACGVDAPHQRYRVWFVANRTDTRIETMRERENGVLSSGDAANTQGERGERLPLRTKQTKPIHGVSSRDVFTTDTINARPQRNLYCREPEAKRNNHKFWKHPAGCTVPNWTTFPTQPPVCSRDDGFSARLARETFLDGKRLTPAKHREKSIEAYGNAIVPQVVYQIFETINEYEKLQR